MTYFYFTLSSNVIIIYLTPRLPSLSWPSHAFSCAHQMYQGWIHGFGLHDYGSSYIIQCSTPLFLARLHCYLRSLTLSISSHLTADGDI